MAQITKAAMDAAIEQGKREATAQYQATISRLRAEKDDLRIKLDAEIEAGRRSIENAIDKNKSGRWRDNPKAVFALLGLAAIILFAVLYFATSAKADEPCEPQLVYPPDLHLDCINGRLVVDSDLMPIRLETAIRCRSGMT